MDRFLGCYNRDSIKSTLLKHEEMFRHQVHELHRLYKVQKMMMIDLRSKEVTTHSLTSASPRMFSDTRSRHCNSASNSENSHSSHVNNTHNSTSYLQSEHGPPHPYCTVACSGGAFRVQKGFDLEQPVEEYGSMEATARRNRTTLFGEQLKGKSKIEGSRLWPEDETDIQLTLKIGR